MNKDTLYNRNEGLKTSNALEDAYQDQFEWVAGTLLSDTIKLFDDLAFYDIRRKNVSLTEQNTIRDRQNKMTALDNRVLFAKNQLQNSFNAAVASDIVRTAARGLRVSTANILEKHKESAYNVTIDKEMLESNANLSKSAYRADQQQASLLAKAQKRALKTDLISDSLDFASDLLTTAVGGIDSESGSQFGKLFGGFSGENNTSYAKLAWDFITSK